ncbi:MAG: hypothetical protein R3B97_09730 [Dehalococcoidia bacterium]
MAGTIMETPVVETRTRTEVAEAGTPNGAEAFGFNLRDRSVAVAGKSHHGGDGRKSHGGERDGKHRTAVGFNEDGADECTCTETDELEHVQEADHFAPTRWRVEVCGHCICGGPDEGGSRTE